MCNSQRWRRQKWHVNRYRHVAPRRPGKQGRGHFRHYPESETAKAQNGAN